MSNVTEFSSHGNGTGFEFDRLDVCLEATRRFPGASAGVSSLSTRLKWLAQQANEEALDDRTLASWDIELARRLAMANAWFFERDISDSGRCPGCFADCAVELDTGAMDRQAAELTHRLGQPCHLFRVLVLLDRLRRGWIRQADLRAPHVEAALQQLLDALDAPIESLHRTRP